MLFKQEEMASWSDHYINQTQRNIGYVTYEEQEKLRITPIGVLGVGGIGGSLAEQLVRSGCERLIICDFDKFDETNLNRQICTMEDIGDYKVNALEKYLKKINPDVKIRKYFNVSEKNIGEMIKNIEVAALSLDGPIASIIIARECKNQNVPMLESWAIPFLFAWWFTNSSISYEQCYNLSTEDMPINQIEQSEIAKLKSSEILFSEILKFPGIKSLYDRQEGAYSATISGEIGIRSFASVVRLTASYLAFEIIYAGILNIKNKVLAPQVKGYDYFRMKPLEFSMKK